MNKIQCKKKENPKHQFETLKNKKVVNDNKYHEKTLPYSFHIFLKTLLSKIYSFKSKKCICWWNNFNRGFMNSSTF